MVAFNNDEPKTSYYHVLMYICMYTLFYVLHVQVRAHEGKGHSVSRACSQKSRYTFKVRLTPKKQTYIIQKTQIFKEVVILLDTYKNAVLRLEH